jgi:teichuronic acid biosynthesis glycosyltransferase TuaC
MRVLFYSSIFPRAWNATLGVYCLHLCRALRDLGHEVRVVSPRSWLERPTRNAAPTPGLSDLRVEYPTFFHPPRILRNEYHRFMALSSRRAMRRAMAEFQPDCVLSYWAHPDGAVAARFARAAGIPAAVIVGGSDVLILGRQSSRRSSVIRALRDIDAIIAVSRDLASVVVDELGIPQRKVHVVYQGIDKALFTPGSSSEARRRLGIPESGQVLLTVGSLVPVKGIDVLLESFARLRTRVEHRGLRLYLVGDGTSRSALEAQGARLGLSEALHFTGKVDQRQLPDWYRAANLMVLASRSEGIPNVLRESLSCKTPFVATHVGGVHELAAGTQMPLVPPDDPVALAEAIAASLAKPAPSLDAPALTSWRESTQQIVDVFTQLRAACDEKRTEHSNAGMRSHWS